MSPAPVVREKRRKSPLPVADLKCLILSVLAADRGEQKDKIGCKSSPTNGDAMVPRIIGSGIMAMTAALAE
jgi:hypothetical protein